MTHDKASSKNITHDVVSMCVQSNHNKKSAVWIRTTNHVLLSTFSIIALKYYDSNQNTKILN